MIKRLTAHPNETNMPFQYCQSWKEMPLDKMLRRVSAGIVVGSEYENHLSQRPMASTGQRIPEITMMKNKVPMANTAAS